MEERAGRGRGWRPLHVREAPQTLLAVVRVEDPASTRPLRLGPTAGELTTDESRAASGHRGPVETNFSGAQGSWALERPRAWTETALARRSRLAWLAGSRLKALAAGCAPLPLGPGDGLAVSSAGRVANHWGLPAGHFATLALQGLAPRTYRKIPEAKETAELQLPLAA